MADRGVVKLRHQIFELSFKREPATGQTVAAKSVSVNEGNARSVMLNAGPVNKKFSHKKHKRHKKKNLTR
jgi:hypothetical protein